MTSKASKCCIGGPTVKYLGREVGSGKLATASAKVEVNATVQSPATKRELRRFLGMVGFYRRFIPWFADVARLLTNLLKGGEKGRIPITWGHYCQQAFEQLKQSLLTRPILRAPNFTIPFEMYTDASGYGLLEC